MLEADEGQPGGGELPLFQVPEVLGAAGSHDLQSAEHCPCDDAQIPGRLLRFHLEDEGLGFRVQAASPLSPWKTEMGV